MTLPLEGRDKRVPPILPFGGTRLSGPLRNVRSSLPHGQVRRVYALDEQDVWSVHYANIHSDNCCIVSGE